MSLETQITNLISQYTALKQRYESRIDEIDAAVADALRTVPDNDRVYYVNPAGDDDADGSSNTPLATIHEAMDRGVRGGRVRINLSDGEHRLDSAMNCKGMDVVIDGSGSETCSIVQTVSTARFDGNGTIGISSLSVSTAGSGSPSSAINNGLIYIRGGNSIHVSLHRVKITLNADWFISCDYTAGFVSLVMYGGSVVIGDAASPAVIRSESPGIALFSVNNTSLPSGTSWADLLKTSGAFLSNVGV